MLNTKAGRFMLPNAFLINGLRTETVDKYIKTVAAIDARMIFCSV